MRRKHVIAVAGFVLLAVVGLVAVLSIAVDVDRYRARVQATLAEHLGRDVSLGRMHLSVAPFGLRVENAVIGDDPAFQTGRPFAQAEMLYVSPRPWSLLRGRLELRSVELRRPVIELVRNAAGAWNTATLGRDGAGASRTPLTLHRLVVTGGEIAVTDRVRRDRLAEARAAPTGGRMVYHNIDLQISDYASGRPFAVVLAATLPGTGTQRLAIRGTVGPIVEDHIAMTPFEGAAEFKQVSYSGLHRFLEIEALDDTDALISGSANIRSRDGRWSSKGSLGLEQPRARGLTLGYPIVAAFDVEHDSASEVLTIRSATLRLDRTPLSIEGSVNLRPDTPTLDVHVTASDVSLAEVARLASAFGVAFGAGTRAEGRLKADVHARGPANRPALDGQLRLRDVVVSGTDIPRPVRTQAVELSLTPDEIRSNQFSLTTNGTSLDARFTLSRYATATPALDASVRTAGADVGDVLNIARAWGVGAAEGMSGTGRLTLDVRAVGPTDDPTFTGSGTVADASLKAPSIAQPLRIRRASLAFASNAARVENFSASIGKTSAEGRVTVRNFTAPQVDFDVTADRIDVTDMQAVLQPARGPQPPTEPQRRAKQRAAEEGLLLRTAGSGRLRVGSITYGQLVLDNVQTTAALDCGLIRLDPLTAGLFGGRHRGSIVIDARRTPSAVTMSSDLEQVDANRLATAVADIRDVIYGALASVIRVNFSTDGVANIARSLNGTLALNMPKGRIASMDLMNEVATVAQFLGAQRSTERGTAVTGLKGSFKVTNGLARTDDLAASVEGGRLGASGSVNLVNQALNLRTTVVLSRDISRQVGGVDVGGYMATVLANRQGELVVPMLVTGTLQQPRFAPDVERIAEMKLRNLVPGLSDPMRLGTGILSEDLLGAIAGGKPPVKKDQKEPATTKPEPKAPAQQLEDALEQLLGGYGKPRPKPTPPRK